MIESITLKNYKSFKDETTIQLKPLTILCGINSSGKSSIIKSLLMLKQSCMNHNTKGEITYNGDWVNNGNFSSMANNKKEEIFIKNSFQIKSTSYNDRNMYKELYRTIYGESIKTDSLKNVKYKNNAFEISYGIKLKNKRVIEYHIVINHNYIEEPIDVLISLRENCNYFITINNLYINGSTELYPNIVKFEAYCYFDGINITNIYAYNMSGYDIQPVLNFINVFFKNISNQYLYGVEHIAPLRYEPARHYISNSSYNSVGISGENAIQLLNEISKRKVKAILAPVDENLVLKSQSTTIDEVVKSWLDYTDMGYYDIKKSGDEDDEIIKFFVNARSIADVGFGVSQILPIIIEGAKMDKFQTLLLEQPEIHLHPKAQMKIADYMISLMNSDKHLVVETHSDHIINRIVRRCLENPKLIEKISILFLNKDESDSTVINEISIDTHLGIDEAPKDFFDQYASETDIIVNQGYRNMTGDKNK